MTRREKFIYRAGVLMALYESSSESESNELGSKED